MSDPKTRHHDCIVLGAGAVGLSSALHLLEAGLDVLCLDHINFNNIAASSASGAMLGAITELSFMSFLNDAEENTFIEARRYHDLFKDKLSSLNGKTYDINDGIFVVAGTLPLNNDYLEVEHQINICKKYNLNYERVPLPTIPGYNPLLRTNSEEAVYFPFDGFIDSSEFLTSIKNAVSSFAPKKYSFKCIEVLSVKRDGNKFIVECNPEEKFSCTNVLFSTGAFSQRLLNDVIHDHKQKFYPLAGRGVSIQTSKLANLTKCIRTPNRDFACGLHLVPNKFSSYIGATNRVKLSHDFNNPFPLVNEVQFLINSTIDELNKDVKQLHIQNSRVGYRPLFMDRRPMVGNIEDGVWIANGTYRNGMLLSPLVGKEICDAIVTGTPPRAFWNSNRDCLAEFEHTFYTENENWVKNVKKEIFYHISKANESQKEKIKKKFLSIEKYCEFIYDNILLNNGVDLTDGFLFEARQLFQKAPLRENLPNVLNLLLSKEI